MLSSRVCVSISALNRPFNVGMISARPSLDLDVVQQLLVQTLHNRRVRAAIHEVDVLARPVEPLAGIPAVIVQLRAEALVHQHPPEIAAAWRLVAWHRRALAVEAEPRGVAPVVRTCPVK